VTKGTYIRSLCHDIGQALGTNAVMTVLVRIASKNLNIEDSFTLEQIDDMFRLNDFSFLLGYDKVLDLESIYLDDDSIGKLMNGIRIPVVKEKNYPEYFYIRNLESMILGIGEVIDSQHVKFKKLLI
jgi:tRNA pseudouridine55 synthase